MHREGQMQFQSPVSLRLLPTLPARNQLKPPPPSGSQTERGGGAANNAKNTGSSTHRAMVSTNATSLAAVKHASERNQSLFDKISASVSNISAALRADAVRDADAAEEADAAQVSSIFHIQNLKPLTKNMLHRICGTWSLESLGTTDRFFVTTNNRSHFLSIRPPAQPVAAASTKLKSPSGSVIKHARSKRLSAAASLSSSASAASAHAPAPPSNADNPLIEQIERLMVACGAPPMQPVKFTRAACAPSADAKAAKKGGKEAAKAPLRSGEPGVVRVRHVPLGCV